MFWKNLVRERVKRRNTYRENEPTSPIDEIELGQPIKQLHNENFFPYGRGKTVCSEACGLSEARNHEGMICGFRVERAVAER
jgi:hypothetical protein